MSSSDGRVTDQPTAGRYGELLRLHRELDVVSRKRDDADFLSGWQTRHPFAEHYLSPMAGEQPESVQTYTFLSDSQALTKSVVAFHRTRDGVDYPPESIYPSNGSSALLLAFFLRLRERGVTEVHFVPPIYYSCYYFAASLGIALRPVGAAALHEPGVAVELPPRRSVLILSDPIWVLGAPVHPDHVADIARWQRRTGSEILVDGTFQYTAWNPAERPEATAELDPDLTFRVVCPTKSTAVHGIRFAYLVLPPTERESIRYAAANFTGANGVRAEVDALHLMAVLNSPRSNRDLRDHIADVHQALWDSGVIVAEVGRPSVTYYVFARLHERFSNAVLMDQRFFGLTGYDGFSRINLLHPRWDSFRPPS